MGFWDSVKRFLGVEEAEKQARSDEPFREAIARARREMEQAGEPQREARGGSPREDRGHPYRGKARAKAAPQDNPYGQSPIMGASGAEVRARFFELGRGGISPYYHPDKIPDASDEFTQLVDRSLVLAGLLTHGELEEIHKIGRQWLKHKHQREHAEVVARVEAKAAVEALREARRAKRREKRAAAEARRAARREAVETRRREDIIHVGRGVSGSLNDRRSHVERLQAKGLPQLSTPGDLARALGLSVGQLRWLCFHEEAARVSHYRQFSIPKRSGGERVLAAPLPHLARAQRWVLSEILSRLPNEPAAHGFLRGRSTVSNATPHLGRDVVLNLDLKNFFPSVTFPRVRGLFQALGYSPAVASLLALLCTECPRRPMRYAGQRYHVAVGARSLPQGACTSPALANQVARRLDRRLSGLAKKYGWAYTRYADDLSFSAPRGKRGELAPLMAAIRHIVADEGFALNPEKARVQRRGGRQEVTGVVVNDKLGLPRAEVRRLRAILHNAKRTGLDAQNRDNLPHFRAWLEGKLAYLAMVDREKGMALLKELRELG